MSDFLNSPLGLVYVTIIGLVFGSFVTALSYRLPRGIPISRGRSACPACGTTLSVRDLVPVFSWVLSKGGCRHCGVRISWRYPAIELAHAALFLAAAVLIEDALRLVFVLVATPVMVTLATIDLEHHRLPNVLVGLLAAAMMGLRWLEGGDLLIAVVVAGTILAGGLGVGALKGRFGASATLGAGDAKLMAVAALGLPVLALTVVLGGAALATLAVMGWRKRSKNPVLPFGPAILAGLWIGIVVGPAFSLWLPHLV